MIPHIIAILCKLVPTGWELINDRKGDFNKVQDIFVRYGLGILAGVINFFWITGKPVFDSLLLSMGIHFAIFDYAIAYWLIRTGKIEPPRGVKYHWFDYLGNENPFDSLWNRWNKWVRFSIRVVVLAAAIVIYIIQR
jgi:hypothetical protein